MVGGRGQGGRSDVAEPVPLHVGGQVPCHNDTTNAILLFWCRVHMRDLNKKEAKLYGRMFAALGKGGAPATAAAAGGDAEAAAPTMDAEDAPPAAATSAAAPAAAPIVQATA